jgi:dUTP pyrophosphatase
MSESEIFDRRMQIKVPVRIKRLPHGHGLPLPEYATSGAAGMDVVAAEQLILRPAMRQAVSTGFAVALPPGYEMQVRPRSGLALKHGITVANSPGTVDADYRGEVKVILVNLSDDNFTIQRGDRIAQLVVSPVTLASWAEVDELDDTARGEGGFGSTGGHAGL